jgi:hypothetical protein
MPMPDAAMRRSQASHSSPAAQGQTVKHGNGYAPRFGDRLNRRIDGGVVGQARVQVHVLRS